MPAYAVDAFCWSVSGVQFPVSRSVVFARISEPALVVFADQTSRSLALCLRPVVEPQLSLPHAGESCGLCYAAPLTQIPAVGPSLDLRWVFGQTRIITDFS